MSYEDKMLSCKACNQQFLFSAGEQEFYALKELTNIPKNCPNCRLAARMKKTGKDSNLSTEVPCYDCGAVTLVPFKPTGAKPVYCSACFHKQKLNS